MELKERYVYAVVSKLPEKQREDIAKEIRSLIDDMMESIEGNNDEEKLEKVLLELGDPNDLADKYRDHSRYLIGPKYYNNYIYTLKIVCMAIFIGISISSIVGLFSDNVAKIYLNYFTTLISALFQGFIWVTIIFAIFEYKQVDLSESKDKWNLKKLQPIPSKKAVISRAETIVGIVFSTLFLILFYSEVFAIYFPTDEGLKIIQIFNYEQLSYFKPLILVIFLIGIAKEVLKLIYGKWNIKLAIFYTITSTLSTILFVILFKNPLIWNSNIQSELAKILTLNNELDLLFNFERNIRIIIIIAIVGTIIDITTALYKGIKYQAYNS